MKLPCELIQDLLPLYHDGVCSEVSKETVRAHLDECEGCRKTLEAMDAGFQAAEELEAAKPLASVGKIWQKTRRKALWKGAGITALIFAVVVGCLLALTQWKWISIDTGEMRVAEIYRMEDGRILYRLEVPNGVWTRTFAFEHHADGSDYIIPKRSMIELGEQQGLRSLLDSYLMLDVAEVNAVLADQGIEITRCYLGNPDDAEQLLIWEEGMELEPAPAELETIYG